MTNHKCWPFIIQFLLDTDDVWLFLQARKTQQQLSSEHYWLMAKQNARSRKRKPTRGQRSLSLFPMISKDHRTYINRRVDVPNSWWKGTSDEGHTTCIVHTHDPSHAFETMRNVHAIGLKIADLRTDAEKSSDEVDPEYYQTVFWINMKAFSQFWHESNPPAATADDTTGSSQDSEMSSHVLLLWMITVDWFPINQMLVH